MPPNRPKAKPLKKLGASAKKEAPDAVVLARSRGALLGLCVGEALGVPYENKQLPAEQFPKLNEGPIDLRGGGRFELKHGQPSWATQMATALSHVLREQGRFDAVEVGKAYAKWVPHAFDVPEAVRLACEQIAEGRSGEYTGKRVFLESAQSFKDNASLARTAPLGLFYLRERDERRRASLEDSAITHFAPQCQLACATFNGVLAAAVLTPKERLENDEVLKVAETELGAAAALLGRAQPDWVTHVKDAADWLREDLAFAKEDDPELYGPELHLFFPRPTWVRIAFRLAFWELLHAPSFEAGLTDVVLRGGDADTHGAIVGALLGAKFGESALPSMWKEAVLDHLPAQGVGALSNVYHPKFLVTFAGAKPGAAVIPE
jgi:ADP-ribosyl-[dinitrogen reductase] hydrolase